MKEVRFKTGITLEKKKVRKIHTTIYDVRVHLHSFPLFLSVGKTVLVSGERVPPQGFTLKEKNSLLEEKFIFFNDRFSK